MNETPVSQALECDVPEAKRWPLILVATMFFAGIAPAFMSRPAPPPRPAPAATSCTSTPAAPTNASTHAESPTPATGAKGSC
jgi:hypothetical protein